MSTGPKILVVEDNYLLAEVICDFVAECGMHPVGPATDLERGLRSLPLVERDWDSPHARPGA